MADPVLRILLGIQGLDRVRRRLWLVGVLLLVGFGSSLQAAVEITGEVVYQSILGTAKGKTMTSPFTFVLSNQGYAFTQVVALSGGQKIPVRGGFDGQDSYYVATIPGGEGRETETVDYAFVNASSLPQSNYLPCFLLWLAFLGQNEMRDGEKMGERFPLAFCVPNHSFTNLIVHKRAAGQGVRFQMPGFFKGYLHSDFQVRSHTNIQNRVLPTEAVYARYLPPGQQLVGEPASVRELESATLRVQALREVPEPASYRPAVNGVMDVQDMRFSDRANQLHYSVTNQWLTREDPRLQAILAQSGCRVAAPSAAAPPAAANAARNLLFAWLVLAAVGGAWAMIFARNSAPRPSAN